MAVTHTGLLLLLLLLLHWQLPICLAQHRNHSQPPPSYGNIWEAALSESWFWQQVWQVDGEPLHLDAFANVLNASTGTTAQSSTYETTVLLPGPKKAWERLAQENCMSLPAMEWELRYKARTPGMYLSSFFVESPFDRVDRDIAGFFDGLLRSLQRQRRSATFNGTTGMVLWNASAIRMPGTRYTYEDVHIIKGDIKAGAAVVHITDLPIRTKLKSESTQVFLTSRCPPRQQLADRSPGTVNTKAVGIGVAFAGAGSVALVYIAVLLKRKGHGLHTVRKFLGSYMPSGCGCLSRSRADVNALPVESSSNIALFVAPCDPIPQPDGRSPQAGTLPIKP